MSPAKFINLACAVLGFIVFGLGALNISGFCFSERRFLSDNEKFKLVVDGIIKNRMPFYPVKPLRPGKSYWSEKEGDKISHWVLVGQTEPVEPIDYKSTEEFFLLNPNCCEMREYVSSSEGVYKPSELDRLFGNCSGGVVRVNGTFRYRDKYGVMQTTNRSIDALLNNCGRWLQVPL